MADLVKLREARRQQPPTSVAVGSVNVEAGGQAIVGQVEIADRHDDATESVSRKRRTDPEDKT